MTAYTTTFNPTAPELVVAALERAAERLNTATENLTLATRTVLMLVGAPLLGLAFVIALPVLSVWLAAYYAGKVLAARRARIVRRVKNIGLFLVAPFVGLAYIVAFPFVGIGMLCYYGVKAARN